MFSYNIRKIKNVLSIIIITSFFFINILQNKDINDEFNKLINSSISAYINNITNIPKIQFLIYNINYSYSHEFDIIEIIYYINFFNADFDPISPSNISLLYNLRILCDIYSFETNEIIYSIANIEMNKRYFCIEHIKIKEQAKFGIKIFKINDDDEKIEYCDYFFFSEKIININNNSNLINNNKFNLYYIHQRFNKILSSLNNYKNNQITQEEVNHFRGSFLQPPVSYLKRDIAQIVGRWYYNNIYETYFCFCKGETCLFLPSLYMYNYQYCKYYIFLNNIYQNKDLYPKNHYLLSDFFEENTEPSDAFPIFKEMIKMNLNAHYITRSSTIYNEFCLINEKCLTSLPIINGNSKINGDTLEKYFEIFLRLKAVIAGHKFEGIDNIFYNIEYITYICLGHGVTYIKSFLYKDYLSPKRYNKFVLPPTDIFIDLAIKAGWKNEDIIKIGYPRWDNYKIFKKSNLSINNSNKEEKSIFLMFTWRKTKKGKNVSDFYYNNLYDLLNNQQINEELIKSNTKIYYCYHHSLVDKKNLIINNQSNIILIEQSDISILLKNSSLIITDFSSILFDAIVQRKPLILFIPDGLDSNLKDIYSDDYYETINKIKNGILYLYEVYFNLNEVINKIIFYIKNNFDLEKEKLNYYKQFHLGEKDNTKKFIEYLEFLK